MAQKPVLGKGLASLLPGAAATAQAPSGVPTTPNTVIVSAEAAATPAASAVVADVAAPNKDRHPGISLASVDEIEANEYQPRRDFDEQALSELSESIRSNGIIQPLVVRKTDQGYQLIAGERRLRAAKMAGVKQVPIVIRKSTDREALELALVENIQRRDLNCIDEALAYFQLIEDFTLTQEEVARRVGKERASVANHLRLLRLPEGIIDDLRKGVLSFGHGKVLLGLDENDLRLFARKEIVEKQLSVRDAEGLIERLKAKKMGAGAEVVGGPAGGAAIPVEMRTRLYQIAQDLTRKWSTRVELKGTEKKGKIVLHYANRSELERLIASMQTNELWPEKTT